METRNGRRVIASENSSAGRRGSRRRHAEANGSPTRPFSATSAAAAVKGGLLERLRCDLLALADRVRVLHRACDDGREQLRAAVTDILELRDPDVLNPRQPRSLRRAR